MERLYKGFGFMQNHFHPQNQQRLNLTFVGWVEGTRRGVGVIHELPLLAAG